MYVAIDKNDKNPNTSVKVVRTIPDANAGSIFILLIVIGIIMPTQQANPKFIKMAKDIANANTRLSNQ